MAWESWVEKQIRQAQERGEFDNLPGVGKPLDLGNPDDPDWWIKRFIAREGIDTSQPLHPTLALRREAKTYPAALADIRDEAQVREIVRDFNRRVVEDRLRPVRGAAMPPVAPRLDVQEMVDAWRELRAQSTACLLYTSSSYRLRNPSIAMLIGDRERINHQLKVLAGEPPEQTRNHGDRRTSMEYGSAHLLFPMPIAWTTSHMDVIDGGLVILAGNNLSGLSDLCLLYTSRCV